MELRFIKQRHQGGLTELDVIELVNCERGDGYQNGEYTVAEIQEDGGILIIGMGSLAGVIAVIYLD